MAGAPKSEKPSPEQNVSFCPTKYVRERGREKRSLMMMLADWNPRGIVEGVEERFSRLIFWMLNANEPPNLYPPSTARLISPYVCRAKAPPSIAPRVMR